MSATQDTNMSNCISVGWQVISGIHTPEQAPQYADKTIFSAQDSDAMDEAVRITGYPATLEDSCFDGDEAEMGLEEEAHTARYPPSLHTDHSSSTSAAGTVRHSIKNSLVDQMETLLYHLEHPFDATQEPRLTEKTLKAHDVDATNHGYHRDLTGWCRDGALFVGDAGEGKQLSDSMVVTHQTKSHATEAANSSCSAFSAQTYLDRTAENVTGAGGIFFELVAAPQTLDDDIIIVDW